MNKYLAVDKSDSQLEEKDISDKSNRLLEFFSKSYLEWIPRKFFSENFFLEVIDA